MIKSIKILGTGCPKCKLLSEITREMVELEGIDAEIEKVEDISEILKFGVPSTPALIVDGNVKSFGRIPSKVELFQMLK